MRPGGRSSLRTSLFLWISFLYFAEGLPLGIFYDVFPVHFRQQGVELWKIGFMSLLGLSWTIKFLWAPAIDHYRHHRRWMFGVDLLMAGVLLVFAAYDTFGTWTWVAIGAFTLLSATNDIAIDGYSIELLKRRELGLANGVRIGAYRVGLLATGVLLALTDVIGWSGAYIGGGVLMAGLGVGCLLAPAEAPVTRAEGTGVGGELLAVLLRPIPAGLVLGFLVGAVWLANRATGWSEESARFWPVTLAVAGVLLGASVVAWLLSGRPATGLRSVARGPVFGALFELLGRRHIVPVIVFILIFKLADTSMGFMVKPFWVDAGFSAADIGLVSVNVGLGLSIVGGLVGGWITDRVGIFRGLWTLGLTQAVSNLGYAAAAAVIHSSTDVPPELFDRVVVYSASAIESFTSGLGTGAFLAFLMAIVDRRAAASEYAILSSVFALSRSVSGWLGGFGAELMGYAPYFFLTFFLAFPAYGLLPWVRRMLDDADRTRPDDEPAATPTS